ncbi:MAG: hypothetical protein AAF292_00835 [Pseudomonadota bacterium]
MGIFFKTKRGRTAPAVYKSALASSAAILLAACGGSSSDTSVSAAPPPTASPPPPPVSSGVSFISGGSGSLGLILGGTVEIQDAETGAVLATGQTSTTNGLYSVTVPESAGFDGPFIRVIVSGDDDAVMVCDAPSGCGTTAFGITFPIDATESVQILLPTPVGGAVTATANKLTTLASALAEAAPGGLTALSIAEANSQVADLFGIIDSDLGDIANVNIAGGVLLGSADELRVALINAGILEALFQAGASDIGPALDAFVDNFISDGGQLIIRESTPNDDVVSLEEILQGAVDAGGLSSIASNIFEGVSAGLGGDLADARAAPADTFTEAVPSPNAGATNEELAKAFVADLQLIFAAVEEEQEAANLEAFAERVGDAAEALIDTDEAEAALEAAIVSVDAILAAFDQFSDDNTLTTVEVNGEITVAIADTIDGAMFTINQLIDGTAVSIEAIVNSGSIVEVDTFNNFSQLISGMGSFSGTIENSLVRLEIAELSATIDELGLFDVNEFESDFGVDLNVDRKSISVGEATLLFDATLTDLSDSGLILRGLIGLELLGGEASSGETFFFTTTGLFDNTGVGFEERSVSLDVLSVSFSGDVTEGADTVELSFLIAGGGQNVTVTDSPEKIDAITYSVEPGLQSLTVDSDAIANLSIFIRGTEFSLISASQAEAELLTFDDSQFDLIQNFTSISGEEITQKISSDLNLFFASSFFTGAPVLRIETNLASAFPGSTNAEFLGFFQVGTAGTLLFDPPDDFGVSGAPNNIIDYLNPLLQNSLRARLVCTIDDRLVLLDAPVLTATENPIQATVVLDDVDCSSAFGTGFFNNNFFFPESSVEFSDDAFAVAVFSASVRQDLTGIDPDDPTVELSVFGEATARDGDFDSILSVQLFFAGRRFETDSRGFDIIDDLTETPLFIRNQDGVVLRVSEDSNGEISGEITVDGVTEAEISEIAGDILIATFNDGSFVSIN